MVSFLRLDPMVSGSNPTSAKLSLRMTDLPALLCNATRRNHEVWSHREEGPGHCLISEKLLSVPMSTFDIWAESYIKRDQKSTFGCNLESRRKN